MDQLNAILSDELEFVQRFIECLLLEQKLLLSNSTEEFAANLDTKLELSSRLNDLELERCQLLENFGVKPEFAKEWFLRPDVNALSTKLWMTLMDSATKAKELHNQNSKLLADLLKHTNQALSILVPASATPNLFYGRDGQPSEGTGNRIVDSA